MSILDNTELTTEEKVHNTRTSITRLSNKLYSKVNKTHAQLFNEVWDNPLGLTPQQVLDDYGTDAEDLFTFCSAIQTMLSQADSNYEVLIPTHEFEIEEDGTVTVGEIIS